MRVTAARLIQHGQPLQIEELDLAEPGDEEAVLEIAYAGVNPVDTYAARGLVAPDAPLPRTLGGEAAGTVDGRPVMVRGYGLGATRDGVWASAAVVPRGALIDVPEGVDLAAAATMGVAGATAWRTVTEVGEVTAADTVLVLGAKGGVGSMIVSLAHSLGATVAGQTGHADNHDWITAHGADYVVVAAADGLDEALADLRPTVVFDPLGGGFTGAAIEVLQPYGRLVLFGASAGPEGLVPLRSLYRKGVTLLSYAGLQATDEELKVAIVAAMQSLAAGSMKVTIDSAVPLEQVNDAFTRLASREVRGKLVLDPRT
jgi:NADPH2:quinone reductase